MTLKDLNEPRHITFKTNKATNDTLTQLAHIQGKTQPQLIEEICQAYIQDKLLEFIHFAEQKGINIAEFFEEK